jgi:phosphatidylinositol N-acetylglucosaminyltransferase subunit H
LGRTGNELTSVPLKLTQMHHFAIHLPSPTTVSFTVSTRPLFIEDWATQRPWRWLPRGGFFALMKHSLRVILMYFTILVNLAKTRGLFGVQYHSIIDTCLKLSLLVNIIKPLAERLEWLVLIPASLVMVFLCLRRDYVEESLLVLQGLGIQTATSSSYFFTSPTTTFIPTTQIQDIVIHEAFKGLEVRYYLAVVVHGQGHVVVVFPV